MRRLKRLDLLLLLLVVPTWAIAFVLHVAQVAQGRLAWVGVYVAGSSEPDGFPRVRAFWPGMGAEASGLWVGDTLVAVGDEPLRGVGPVGFVARALHVADEALSAAVTYERDGARGTATLHLTPAAYPWRIAPFSAAMVVTGALVLLRLPRAPIGRTFFLAVSSYGLQWTFFAGASTLQTYCWALVFLVTSTVAFPLCLRATLSFPEEAAPSRMPWWPWVLAAFGPAAFTWVFGTPLPPALGQQAAFVVNVAAIVAMLAVVTRNLRRAGPIGRRQLKWVVYGFYVSLVPVLVADAVTTMRPALWWLHEVAAMSIVLLPCAFLIALVRYNLFDIDRLIAATAVYSLLSFLFLVAILVVVPPAARAATTMVDLDPAVGQIALSGLFAVGILALRRVVRTRVERTLFAERFALREGVDALLRGFERLEDRDALLQLAAERLAELLRPEHCTLYVLRDDGYRALVGGRVASAIRPPSRMEPTSPAIRALQEHGGPIDLQGRTSATRTVPLSAEARTSFATLEATIVLPVRRGGVLVAAVVLGDKRSGDVYTDTDLALLGTVAKELSAQLLRIDLGRYAPRDVVEIFVRDPGQLVPRERELSIFFSDMQDSTRIAEALPLARFRALHEEYVQAMANVIGQHDGVLLRTIGDAIVALWNAPREVDAHPALCCAAAVAMQAALIDLNARWSAEGCPAVVIRMGIHTGVAAVGNFGSSQRVEYDIRGDAANLAARLEGLNKAYGTRTIVSEATRERLDDRFVCRELDLVRVVGRARPEVIHELLTVTDRGDADAWALLLRAWSAALATYRRRAWEDALAQFEAIVRDYSGDGPGRAYVARCRGFAATPPPPDWDGVHEATAK